MKGEIMKDRNFLTGGIYTIGDLDREDGTTAYLVINQDKQCVYFYRIAIFSADDLHEKINKKITSNKQALKELVLYLTIPENRGELVYKYYYTLNNRPFLPQGGEVVGYLGQVPDEMLEDLKDLIRDEYKPIVIGNSHLEKMLE